MILIPDIPFDARPTRRRWLRLGGLGGARPVVAGSPEGRRGRQRQAGAVVRVVSPARRPKSTRHLGHEAGRAGRGARRIPPGRHERPRRPDHRAPAADRPAGAPLSHRAVDDAFGHQPQRGDVPRDDRQPAAARADRLHADRERLPPPWRPTVVRRARPGHGADGGLAARRGRATAPTPVRARTAASSAPRMLRSPSAATPTTTISSWTVCARPSTAVARRTGRRCCGRWTTAWAGWPTTAGSTTWGATGDRPSRC